MSMVYFWQKIMVVCIWKIIWVCKYVFFFFLYETLLLPVCYSIYSLKFMIPYMFFYILFLFEDVYIFFALFTMHISLSRDNIFLGKWCIYYLTILHQFTIFLKFELFNSGNNWEQKGIVLFPNYTSVCNLIFSFQALVR